MPIKVSRSKLNFLRRSSSCFQYLLAWQYNLHYAIFLSQNDSSWVLWVDLYLYNTEDPRRRHRAWSLGQTFLLYEVPHH